MIVIGSASLKDEGCFVWKTLSIEAQLDSHGHIQLTLSQAYNPGSPPWDIETALMPTLSVESLMVFRDLLDSIIQTAKVCTEARDEKK